MAKENAMLNVTDNYSGDSFDFDDLEKRLHSQLDGELLELDFLDKEMEKVGDLDGLGETMKDVVWEQFINQIAVTAGGDFIKENSGLHLDLRNDAHIQTTDNFKKGKVATHNTAIDYQNRYEKWQSNFQKDERNIIKKNWNGSNKLTKAARKSFDVGRDKGSASVHKDHTISAAEITRDTEAAAHLSKSEKVWFANSDINLNDLDASANMSKGDRKMKEWLKNERNEETPSDRFNINEEDLIEKDEVAREKYGELKEDGKERSIETGKQSQRQEAFKITGKALRAVVMQLFADFMKEIFAKLIKWFKSAQRTLGSLLSSIKKAISAFVGKMKTHLINAGNTLLTTIATAIVGPVVGGIKKVWIVLKQGWKSLKEAVNYIKSPENKGKPIGRLLFETGKIVVAGLSGVGAIALGEGIEKGLLAIPIFAIEIPLLGSLASVLGIFMGAVVAGIVGAIAINLIEKAIAKQRKADIIVAQVDKGNEVLITHGEIRELNEAKLIQEKQQVTSTIKERHLKAQNDIKKSLNTIFNEDDHGNRKEKFDEMDALLNDLLD